MSRYKALEKKLDKLDRLEVFEDIIKEIEKADEEKKQAERNERKEKEYAEWLQMLPNQNEAEGTAPKVIEVRAAGRRANRAAEPSGLQGGTRSSPKTTAGAASRRAHSG